MTKELPTVQNNFCPRCGVVKFCVIKMEGRIRNQSFSAQYGANESFTNTTFDGCQCLVCGEEWAFLNGKVSVANTPIEPDHDWMSIFENIVSGIRGNIDNNVSNRVINETDLLWTKLQVRKHNVLIHKELLIKRNSVPNPPNPPPLETWGGNVPFHNPINPKE